MPRALGMDRKTGDLHPSLSRNTDFRRNKMCPDGSCLAAGTSTHVAAQGFRNSKHSKVLHTCTGKKTLDKAWFAQVSSQPCLSPCPSLARTAPSKISQNSVLGKCWTQGILIFSGCISTEELWMATNCSYYANETAHLEIADVALLKMQELLVWKVQFNKPSLLKTLKPQNTKSL